MEQPIATDVSTGSSPAPAAPLSMQERVSALSHEDRVTWEMTGDLPDPPARTTDRADTTTADGTTASSATDEASASPTDVKDAASSASDPASKPPKTRTGHKGNADSRIQELLGETSRSREEIARLQGQIDALMRQSSRPDAPRSDSSPEATQQTDYERYLAMPDAPKEESFDSYAKYSAALSVFIADQRLAERDARATQDASARSAIGAVQAAAMSARTRMEQFAAEHPESVERIHPGLLALETADMRRMQGKPVGPQHVLAQCVRDSDYTGAAAEFFSTPDGQREWARLMSLPADRIERAFGRVEAALETPKAPPVTHLSAAHAPATTLGQRVTDPVDAVEAAVKAKDQARYNREMNKRELAGRG